MGTIPFEVRDGGGETPRLEGYPDQKYYTVSRTVGVFAVSPEAAALQAKATFGDDIPYTVIVTDHETGDREGHFLVDTAEEKR